MLAVAGRAAIGTEIYSLEEGTTIVELGTSCSGRLLWYRSTHPAFAGIGHEPVVVPYAAESVVWLPRYLVLVIRDTDCGIPLLLPICRGSGAMLPAIFPEDAAVGPRMHAQGSEGCVLIDGGFYMVE